MFEVLIDVRTILNIKNRYIHTAESKLEVARGWEQGRGWRWEKRENRVWLAG